MTPDDLRELTAWIIALAIATPFACVIGTAVYYRTKYRAGIAMQKYLDGGLFK